jgi:hypothetical protein
MAIPNGVPASSVNRLGRLLACEVTAIALTLLAGALGCAGVGSKAPARAADIGLPLPPPEQAVVVEPGPFWENTGWATILDTAAVTLEDGWRRMVMLDPKSLHNWTYTLAAPVDIQEYPMAVLTYRARNTRPDDFYVVWTEGAQPFVHEDLVADGQVHELRRDMRELAEGRTSFETFAMGIRSDEQAPAELEILQLRFERAPDSPPAKRIEEGDPITVEVVGLEGHPVKGATVTVDAERPNWSRSARTGPDGKATVRPLANWAHRLRVSKKGWISVETAPFSAGDTPMCIELPKGQVWGGAVVNDQGQPIGGAVVTVILNVNWGTANPPTYYSALCNAKGQWKMLLPGTLARSEIRMQAARVGYATEPQDCEVDTAPIERLKDRSARVVIRNQPKPATQSASEPPF